MKNKNTKLLLIILLISISISIIFTYITWIDFANGYTNLHGQSHFTAMPYWLLVIINFPYVLAYKIGIYISNSKMYPSYIVNALGWSLVGIIVYLLITLLNRIKQK